MTNRKKIEKGVHQSKTRKSNTAWSNEAIARNTRAMKELINKIREMIRRGETFYADEKLFPKKKGFAIDQANIQQGNSKLGHIIKSVSLPPVLYCGNCKACKNDCYDLRHDVTQPQCRIYRAANAALYEENREAYWKSIEREVKSCRFFRYHIGGDIQDRDYLQYMVDIAYENPHCEFLAFTKMFDVVNGYMADTEEDLPNNLHIIFSAWPGLDMPNPYHMPISFPVFAEVDEQEFMSTMPSWYWHCGNDCTECALCGQGCWTLKRGEAVGFPLH